MTSLTGADLAASTHLSRRLSVLPTAVGLLALSVLIVSGHLAGLPDQSPWSGSLLWISAVAVGVTVASGNPIGLYVGGATLVLAGLGGDEPASPSRLAVTAGTLFLVHELVRASLDARRPARFGPGLWFRYGLRTAAGVAALAAMAVAGASIGDRSLATWLVPAGLALASLPLFARWLVQSQAGAALPPGRVVRAGIGVTVAAIAVSGALVGAVARSEFENTRTIGANDPEAPVGDPVGRGSSGAEVLDDAGIIERGAGLLLLIIALVVAGFLFVAFRRPEQSFELDDIDLDLDDSSLVLAGPGRADLEDSSVEIGGQELADLLDGLALDIGAERDPGRAIRYAYANVEQRLAGIGIERAESETEQEFLVRSLPSLGAEGRSMTALTGLFERARFGGRAMPERARSEALDAVAALRRAVVLPEPLDGGARRPDAEPGGASSGQSP